MNRACLLVISMLLASFVRAEVVWAVEAELPQDKVVADLLRRLESPDPVVRDTADDALYDLPPIAFPLLEKAAESHTLSPEADERLNRSIEIQRPLQAARARRWAQMREDYIFNETTALTEYRTVGKREQKWDELAERAITAFVAPSMYAINATANEKLEKAISAGCDDPLVLYFQARRLTFKNQIVPARAMMHRAVAAMLPSEYPAFRKIYAVLRMIDLDRYGTGATATPDFKINIDRAMQEFPEACATPHVTHDWIYDWADGLKSDLQFAGLSSKDAFDKVQDALEKAMPNSGIPLNIKGRFFIDYAWEARGIGLADTVTDDGWRKMRERLVVAESALNKAWVLDPTDERSANNMLWVIIGQQQGRFSMEKWFALAMQANPDNAVAMNAKLNYLEPKWYGTEQEALAFARQCGETRRWSERLPLEICSARFELWSQAADTKSYCLQPQVWQDVSDAYSRYLLQRENDQEIRNYYAVWAVRCCQWQVVQQQLTLLGDAVDPAVFGGEETLNQVRRYLADRFPATRPTPAIAH